MQTQLAPEYQNTPEGQEAEAILRKCVHCGFCTATCPTYQTLGDVMARLSQCKSGQSSAPLAAQQGD